MTVRFMLRFEMVMKNIYKHLHLNGKNKNEEKIIILQFFITKKREKKKKVYQQDERSLRDRVFVRDLIAVCTGCFPRRK